MLRNVIILNNMYMKILVPVDFTDITEKGFKYALSLPFANEIILFHAVDDITKSK